MGQSQVRYFQWISLQTLFGTLAVLRCYIHQTLHFIGY
jgi:hypothetical protein